MFENVRPGGYIPEEQIKDMDLDGIDVSILYPTLGLQLFKVPDSELLTAVFKTYNDWLAEFCQAAPKRLAGIAMINVDDVEVAVAELERCHKLGFIGGMITVYPPEDRRYESPVYEPLWAAAQDLGMPLGLHAATNRFGSGEGDRTTTNRFSVTVNFDHYVRMSLTDMMFCGVFERYPRLQIGAVEHEVSWAAHFLDRMDYNYTQRARGVSGYRFQRRYASQRLLSPGTFSWGSRKTDWGFSFGRLSASILSNGAPTTPIKNPPFQEAGKSLKRSWLNAPWRNGPR